MNKPIHSTRRLKNPLPAVINPPTSVCIQVNVPNDFYHIVAFWNQLFALTKWYAWEADAAHTGKEVARVWQGVYEEARASECMNIQLRTNPFDECGAQYSTDGGVTWVEFFNARECAVDTVEDMTVPKEVPGGANPEPAQCFDLDVVVNANSMRLIPLAIGSGWTIKLTQVQGAWCDGSFLAQWWCADSIQFSMGQCGGNQAGFDGNDPLPSQRHMHLILRLPDGTYDTVPLDGTAYTVPSGQPAGNTFLLANDSVLSDNQGSVSLHLNACSAGWCAEIDFTQTQGGFSAALDGQNQQPLAVYVANVGWQSVHQTSQNDVITAIERSFPANFTPTSIEWFFEASIVGGGSNGFVFESQSVNPPMSSGPSYLFQLNGSAGDYCAALVYANFNGSEGSATITKVRFRGVTGSPPVETECTG